MSWLDVVGGEPVTGAWLGADLGPYPYISGFGLLQRISRLGLLQPAELSGLGLRNRAVLDVLAATQQERVARIRLVEALSLADTKVAEHWAVEPWSPARLDGALDRDPGPLRRCVVCAEHGYHTAIFQLPSITRCPWHGEPLFDRCLLCERPCAAMFDNRGRLGRCACGFDPFRVSCAASGMWEFPTQAADAWLSEYLDWARSEREHRWLVLPEPVHLRTRAFQTLAEPPRVLQSDKTQTLAVTVFDGLGETCESDVFRGWNLLASDRPLTFVPLPADLHGRLTEATLKVIRQLSRTDGPTLELVNGQSFKSVERLEANILAKPDCFITPCSPAADGKIWLNISAIDPTLPVFYGRLLERVVAAVVPKDDRAREEALDRSPAARRSNQLGSLKGAARLTTALEAMLIQGYSQGLDAILRSMARLGPSIGWLVPAVELIGEPGLVKAVRICWVPAAPPLIRRVVEVPASRPSPTGRRCGKARKRRVAGRKILRVR